MATPKNARPDIVVGIDIGQTCSGVAYSIGSDWNDPKILNRYPSAHGWEKADKVATRVGYRRGTEQLQKWGLECVFGDPNLDIREQFKLTLDYEYQDDRGFTCDQARQWYLEYLRCLLRRIEEFFQETVPNWRSMNVEYTFSTPTTWRNPAMIANVEKLVKLAGFGGSRHHTVRMGLTEAEAAAIDVSTTRYRSDDVFLICDSGGGTTDVNVMRVKSLGSRTELQQLDHVEGVSVGSTLIDYRMTEHIVQRLELIRGHLYGDLYCLAEEMLTGTFQTVKHSFPNPVVDEFHLEVKGLAGSQTFPFAGITNSRMAIARGTLKEIFDQQVQQIFSLIDERLRALQQDMHSQQVSYIILSGGFGSSPYLYDQLKRRYEMNEGFRSNNTQSLRIMKALEPQLTVVRGLVKERIQQLGHGLDTGQDVFTTRRCRNSYGVVVSEMYNPSRHAGLPTITRLDGRLWVQECVDWFIIQGEEVNVATGVRRPYGNTIPMNEYDKLYTARIVMSTRPRHQLPRRVTDAGCQSVVDVQYKLTANDMKLKNHQVWKLKKKYYRAQFHFVVLIGPADLKFQIEGSNGILSTDHDSLACEFMDPAGSGPARPTPIQARNGTARYA